MELVSSSGSYPSEELLFGERIGSVRALLQKPSRLWWTSAGFEAQEIHNTYQFGQFPGGTSPTFGGFTEHFANYWTYQGWYRPLFTGIACSERFKIFAKRELWAGASHNVANSAADLVNMQEVMTTAPMTFTGPNKGAEFCVPYYTPQKYLLGRGSMQNGNGILRANMLLTVVADPSTEDPASVVYHSFGPDIRVTNFRQVPRVRFQNGALPDFWWDVP